MLASSLHCVYTEAFVLKNQKRREKAQRGEVLGLFTDMSPPGLVASVSQTSNMLKRKLVLMVRNETKSNQSALVLVG